MEYKYKLEGLDCANCAMKIEKKFASFNDFSKVNLIFATKTLKFHTEKTDVPDSFVQSAVDAIEDGVTVVNLNTGAPAEVNQKSGKKHNRDYSHGHDHSAVSGKKNWNALRLTGALVSLAASMLLEYLNPVPYTDVLVGILCGIAVLFVGTGIIISGFKTLFKFRLDETTLMTIAVIAAFFLGEYIDASLVTILFFIGEIFENKAVASSRREIEKLANIRPDTAILIENGSETTVPAETVRPSQTILVKPHDRIPLDGVILNGATTLDTSAITGESLPVDGGKGTEVLSGMMNGDGLIQVTVTKPFAQSAASRILNLVEESAAKKSSREKIITRFASIYTPIMLALAILIAVVPPLLGFGSFSLWISRSLVCLVASCPCSIVISVPLAYYSGIGASSKIGVLIKGGKYVEALAKADSFVFDKTGTITTGKLSVNSVTSYSSYTETEILNLAAACEAYSSHPIAVSIKNAAKNNNLPKLENPKEKAGYGVTADYNGAELICTSRKALTQEQLAQSNDADTVFVLLNGKLIGGLAVTDTIRPEAKNVISSLKQLGAKSLVMLTGDNDKTAKEVAQTVGMTQYHSELLPQDKVTKMQAQIDQYKTGCFIGDGINDAPVLATASCGIAMGLGSEAAIEAADAVLTSGDLKKLPEAVKLSRRVVNTVKGNIIFSLAVKLVVIILAIMGITPMWLAVFSDTGVSLLCVFNTIRLLRVKKVK